MSTSLAVARLSQAALAKGPTEAGPAPARDDFRQGKVACSRPLLPQQRPRQEASRSRSVRLQAVSGSKSENEKGDGDKEKKNKKVEGFSLESIADEVLDDEESKEMLRDLARAAERVTQAEAALAEQKQRELEAAAARGELERLTRFVEQDEAASAMVSAAEDEVAAAERDVAEARANLVKLRAGNSFPQEKWSTPGIDDDAERIQSGKAAAISGLVGLAASLPVTLAAGSTSLPSMLVSEGAIAASCALFGVCYRYIVRRDMGNTHLKGGAVGAFGLVRGMAQVDSTQMLIGWPDSGWTDVFKAALSAGESVIIFAFAAAALDYSIREGYVKPFPSTGPSSKM